MEYRDFTITIRAEADGGYVTEALDASLRKASSPFVSPFTESMPLAPEKIGDALFQSLFTGVIRDRFLESLEQTTAGGRGLRLRLAFDPENGNLDTVAALPWELLRRPEVRDPLGCQRETPVIRSIAVPRVSRPLEVEPPLRVLAVEASPSNLRPLDIEEEWRRIRRAVEGDDRIRLSILRHVTLDELREELLEGRWHVLHFMGHGGFNHETGEGWACFEDSEGLVHRVPGSLLAQNVKGTDLRLVVLNSCWGGVLPAGPGQDPFVNVAPALVQAGIPAVVAMQRKISDRAAIRFSEKLFTRLTAGDPIEAAVAEGRLAIHSAAPKSREWGTPVLFMGSQEGRLMEAPRRVPRSERPLRLGIRSFTGDGAWAKEMEEECRKVLTLDKPFKGRQIRKAAFWHSKVVPEVRNFLQEAAAERRPLILDFAAHNSIAFLAGYFLDEKSLLDITIVQRTPGPPASKFEWRATNAPTPEDPLWRDEPDVVVAPEAGDVAYAVSVTQPVLKDVNLYLENAGVPVSRIVPRTLLPEPSRTSVREGTHAMQIAQSLRQAFRERTPREHEGVLHLFAAAPNAILFFLGQLCRRIGPVQLYEYDFDTRRPGAYTPSIRTPL